MPTFWIYFLSALSGFLGPYVTSAVSQKPQTSSDNVAGGDPGFFYLSNLKGTLNSPVSGKSSCSDEILKIEQLQVLMT